MTSRMPWQLSAMFLPRHLLCRLPHHMYCGLNHVSIAISTFTLAVSRTLALAFRDNIATLASVWLPRATRYLIDHHHVAATRQLETTIRLQDATSP